MSFKVDIRALAQLFLFLNKSQLGIVNKTDITRNARVG